MSLLVLTRMTMKINIYFFIIYIFLCSGSLHAQNSSKSEFIDYGTLFRHQAKPIVKDSTQNLKIEQVSFLSDRVVISYIKEDSLNSVYFKTKDSRRASWMFHALKLKNIDSTKSNLRIHNVVSKSNRSQLIAFFGSNQTYSTISKDNNLVWSDPMLVNGFNLGKLSEPTYDNLGNMVSYFCGSHNSIQGIESNNAKGVVYKVVSKDGGNTWSVPEYVVRHNVENFDNVSIFETSEKVDGSKSNVKYMLLSSDTPSIPYISRSLDMGKTWSYPKALSSELYGVSHDILIKKEFVYITFKTDVNKNYNGLSDIMLWVGDLKSLYKKNDGKMVVAITNNGKLTNINESERKLINEYTNGYISLYGKKNIYIAASGKWDTGHPTYLIGKTVDIRKINKK